MMIKILTAPAALLCLVLAGCAGDPEAPTQCPQVAVLSQTQVLDVFLPGRNDAAGLVTNAKITGVAGACEFANDKRILRVNFKAGFAATNGPANNSKPLVLPYFVAVTQGDQVITKTISQITIPFDGNSSTAQAVSRPIKIEFPNDSSTANQEILLGFQLTPEQMNFVQTHPPIAP